MVTVLIVPAVLVVNAKEYVTAVLLTCEFDTVQLTPVSVPAKAVDTPSVSTARASRTPGTSSFSTRVRVDVCLMWSVPPSF